MLLFSTISSLPIPFSPPKALSLVNNSSGDNFFPSIDTRPFETTNTGFTTDGLTDGLDLGLAAPSNGLPLVGDGPQTPLIESPSGENHPHALEVDFPALIMMDFSSI